MPRAGSRPPPAPVPLARQDRPPEGFWTQRGLGRFSCQRETGPVVVLPGPPEGPCEFTPPGGGRCPRSCRSRFHELRHDEPLPRVASASSARQSILFHPHQLHRRWDLNPRDLGRVSALPHLFACASPLSHSGTPVQMVEVPEYCPPGPDTFSHGRITTMPISLRPPAAKSNQFFFVALAPAWAYRLT